MAKNIIQEIQQECEIAQREGIDTGSVLYYLGNVYLHGLGERVQDVPVAIYCMMRAAELGNNDAMKSLANIYSSGWEITTKMYRAVEFYEMAADAGDVEAMKTLGELYACGTTNAEKGGIKPDGAKAVAWYEKAVSHGDNYAMEALGDLYKEGRVVKKSLVKAVEWYQKILDTYNWYPMKRSIMEKLVQMYEKAKSPKKVAQWRETLEEAERKYHEEGVAMSKRNGDGENGE